MQPKIELKPNQTILFIGDSITGADRSMAPYRPFGFGFVNFIANNLLAKYPELNLNIVNTGIAANTVRNLKARWKEDCFAHKPNILNVLIGINDLWRRFGGKDWLPDAVYLEEYEDTYRQLLLQAKQQCSCQLILNEPFMFCDDLENQMFKELRGYIDVVHKLAKEFDAVLVPLQSMVDEKIKQVRSDKWSDDFVHPFVWAHAWISQRWFEVTNL